MGTNECSQPASKSSWDSQDFGDVNMVLKMAHFHKSSRPQWVNPSMRLRPGNVPCWYLMEVMCDMFVPFHDAVTHNVDGWREQVQVPRRLHVTIRTHHILDLLNGSLVVS